MSKKHSGPHNKVWTHQELLDRIWSLSGGRRTAVATGELRRVVLGKPGQAVTVESLEAAGAMEPVVKRVVTGWDEDYKPRTYELNKISAASAAALYERIKWMRVREVAKHSADYRAGWDAGWESGRASMIKEAP